MYKLTEGKAHARLKSLTLRFRHWRHKIGLDLKVGQSDK